MDRATVEVDDPEFGRLLFDAVVEGDPDGEVVLLLHGFPETSESWSHQVPALVAAGYRVVAPDQRGYSPRARPAEQAAYSSSCLVGDVLAVADSVGAERFHLVGHDWGGAVAWQVAGRHADRLRSLTVLSTPHPAAFGVALAGEGGSDQASRSGYMDFFRTEGSEDVMLADDAGLLKLVYLGSGLTEEEAAPYLAALVDAGRLAGRRCAGTGRPTSRWWTGSGRSCRRRSTSGAPTTWRSVGRRRRPRLDSSRGRTGSRCSKASITGSGSTPRIR